MDRYFLTSLGKRLAALLFSLTLTLGAAECVVRYGYFDRADRKQGLEALYGRYQTRVGDEGKSEGSEGDACTWSDAVVAHPLFTHVYHNNPPCALDAVNRQGFAGDRDIPFDRESEFFTILVVGASVAEQLATSRYPDGTLILETILNRMVSSPNGRPFRVLNGAVGATAQPVQLAVTALHGHAVDAVVSIDGFNEAIFFHPPARAGAVWGYYRSLIRAPGSAEINFHLSLIARRHAFFRDNFLTKRSYLAFLIFDRVILHRRLKYIEDQKQREIKMQRMPMLNATYPPGLTYEEMARLNIEQYTNFVRMNHAQAKVLDARFAHFLQPIRWIGKTLTEEEKRFPQKVLPEWYQRFVETQRKLGEDTPSFSLVDVFAGETRAIYGDYIHCRLDDELGYRYGYEVMARRMALNLAEAWGLEPGR